MEAITFLNPKLLWLLLLLLAVVAYYLFRYNQGEAATLRMSTVEGVKNSPRSPKYYLRHLPLVLRLMALSLLIVALARPQRAQTNSNTSAEGIDIVIALDISGSMLARDFNPDRITVAKSEAARFIVDRPNDRIGLVVFAGESFTQSPLTTDKPSLLNLLGAVSPGIIEDGTAIGNGLTTAVNRLKSSPSSSKVVILLTDGVNNRGQVQPLTAADIARSLGIKVYTIGVGSEGKALYPTIDIFGRIVFEPQKVEIDEKVLIAMAEKTGGKYFRATDKSKLQAIYDEINNLETTRVEIEHFTRYSEEFAPWALWALVLLLAEFGVRYFYLRRIP